MKTKIAVITGLLVMAASVQGWSMCPLGNWANTKAESASYGEKAGGMLVRGLAGIVESPAELLIHSYQESKDHFDKGLGVARGLGMGVFRMVEHIAIGAVDIVSAPVPGYHGIKSEDQHDWGKKA